MITISDVATSLLTGSSYQVFNRLQVVLGDQVLAEDLPAIDVFEEQDATLRVPERLTFRVPVEDDEGNSWVPTTFTSPLGWFGQRVIAQIGIGVANQAIEWIDRGEFLLNSADTENNLVSVECVGLLQLLDEATLVNEYQPKAAATLGSILRALIEPGITVDLDDAPTDRTAPTGITWSDNRLDNVYAVLDAWPARGAINALGQLDVLPPLDDPVTAVFALTEDPVTGTVMQWNTSGSREGSFNAVVARGQFPDTAGANAGQEILATAYDTIQGSPYVIGGNFSPYVVPFGYASPLMTTQSMVNQAAVTRFKTLRSKASRTVHVVAVPNYALSLYDVVSLTSTRLSLAGELGRVEAIQLPHQAEGGAMGLTVRLAGVV